MMKWKLNLKPTKGKGKGIYEEDNYVILWRCGNPFKTMKYARCVLK